MIRAVIALAAVYFFAGFLAGAWVASMCWVYR
jgi:hypothetical protein